MEAFYIYTPLLFYTNARKENLPSCVRTIFLAFTPINFSVSSRCPLDDTVCELCDCQQLSRGNETNQHEEYRSTVTPVAIHGHPDKSAARRDRQQLIRHECSAGQSTHQASGTFTCLSVILLHGIKDDRPGPWYSYAMVSGQFFSATLDAGICPSKKKHEFERLHYSKLNYINHPFHKYL
jgi:hypothetical protein